jgi:dimethylargininase
MKQPRFPVLLALTREVSPNIGRCQLTHLPREPIDFARARMQHRQLEKSLADLGCEILRLPAAPELPDSVFVQDACVVFDELAVIARPGAETRRPETPAVADGLKQFRKVRFIEPPGTLDGGDVLCLGKRVFVGLSSRTNRAGIEQLRAFLTPHGYTLTPVSLTGCLHLQTAATPVAEKTILVNRSWIDPSVFGDVAFIEVDATEPMGANALLVDNTVVYPAAFPRTRKRLEEHGLRVKVLDVSELAKAEGGVTCCCVLFESEPSHILYRKADG